MNTRIIEYFSELVARHGASPAGLGWTEQSQRRRFEALLGVGDLRGRRVLDVGCGFGDLLDYLRERHIAVEYTGYDITPAAIAIARDKHPADEGLFHVRDVMQSGKERFDYVVANGPLNVACDEPIDAMTALIRRMLDLATVGVAITMTSAYTRRPSPDVIYYDPAIVLARIAPFCRNVRLDHTYLPHDFALFCYKADLYATRTPSRSAGS